MATLMNDTALVWVQIPVRDLDRAAQFYHGVFGAEFIKDTLNGMPHAIFQPDAAGNKLVNGALVEFSDRNPGEGAVLFYDATGKFDIILDDVTKNGGEVLITKTLITGQMPDHDDFANIPKTYIDGSEGYFARFLDSEGNRVGLYGSS